MALLKKIKCSSLLESLVATIIIVLVFMVASLSLNNIIENGIKGDRNKLESRITELEYLLENEKIKIPYYEDKSAWSILVIKKEEGFIIQIYNKISNEASEVRY